MAVGRLVAARQSGAGCWRTGVTDCDLGELERDIAAVARDLRTDLDQLLAKRRQGPVPHFIGQGERAQKVAQVVGQGVQLKTHLVVAEAMAGKPGPVDRVLAFLDVLLRAPIGLAC